MVWILSNIFNKKKKNIEFDLEFEDLDNKDYVKETFHDGKKQIIHLTYIFVGLFIALIFYIAIFVFKDSGEVINNSYNKREEIFIQKIVRGSVLDRNNIPLAYTEVDSNGNEKRVYPYANMFAHAVGFSTNGKMGIENDSNYLMLKSDMFILDRIENDLKGNKNLGNSVVSTLDVDIQKAAYDALGNNKGAIICMNAKTGDILALVSKPDFNPNTIEENWNSIQNDSSSSVLLNRVTQGLYPPGSTFKIITALEYLLENDGETEYHYDCQGAFSLDGSTINCYHGISHGDVDFETSFAKSCNASFANIASTFNKKSFKDTCEDLLFNKDIPCPISNYKNSKVPIKDDSSTDELLQTGIGQGQTQITPFHMCLITSAIANDGLLMNPKIIKAITTANDDVVRKYLDIPYKQLLTRENSAKLKALMREVVVSGTATRIKDTSKYMAYGKTGSAEYNSDKSASHAWFTGYGESSDATIVVTVIIEAGGSGGEKAVPVAKKVLDAFFN